MRVHKSGFAKQEENIDFFMYKRNEAKEKDDGVFYQVMKEKYRIRKEKEEGKKTNI